MPNVSRFPPFMMHVNSFPSVVFRLTYVFVPSVRLLVMVRSLGEYPSVTDVSDFILSSVNILVLLAIVEQPVKTKDSAQIRAAFLRNMINLP